MKAIGIALIIAILSAILATAPTTAQTGTSESVMYEDGYGTFLAAGIIPTSSDDMARVMIANVDAAFVEDTTGLVVLQAMAITGTELKGTGADVATLFAIMDPTTNVSGLFIVLASGSDIIMIMGAGDYLDGAELANYTRAVVMTGIDADPPQGFTLMNSEWL